MSRNYRSEYEWQHKKYTLIKASIEKNIGEQLKEKLKTENKTITGWITENAKKYLGRNDNNKNSE